MDSIKPDKIYYYKNATIQKYELCGSILIVERQRRE